MIKSKHFWSQKYVELFKNCHLIIKVLWCLCDINTSTCSFQWIWTLKVIFSVKNISWDWQLQCCTRLVYILHVHIMFIHFLMTYIAVNANWQQCGCQLSCLLSCHCWVADMAQLISAYAEIKWATGNWQLIGNYAILAKNHYRVF